MGQSDLLLQNGSVTMTADEQRKEGELNCRDAEKAVDKAIKLGLEMAIEALPKEMENTKEESNSDWFYGTGFNSALSLSKENINQLRNTK